LDLKLHFAAHPTEEVLEAYALKRLDAERIPSLENHLLACEACQDALAEVDELIATMKLMEQASPLKQSSTVPQKAAPTASLPEAPEAVSFWNKLADFMKTPRFAIPAFACAVAIAALLLVGPRFLSQGSAPLAMVTLSSLRGSQTLVTAHAGQPLDLGVESTQLAVSPGFQMEMVDASGKPLWRGELTAAGNGRFSARMTEKLSAGTYWVRLYNLNANLVQEFGLKLE
jgi:hypothetical protein